MLDTPMPPPAPTAAPAPADDEPRSAPGGPLAWTATGLLLAAGVLGVVALFPAYYQGGRPLDAHADEVVQTVVVVAGWLGCAALLARHRPTAAQAAAWAAIALSVTEGGLRLADLGQLSAGGHAGPGLWLLTVAWAAGAAGAVIAAVACHRAGALGHLPPPRLGAATPAERVLGVGVGVASVLSAVAFVPSWDRYLVTSATNPSYFASVTLGDAFKNPGLSIAGNLVTAVALGLLPLVALLWRPTRVAAAVIAGTSVVLAAQVLSGAVQVLETPDPLQLLSPTDVRALQPQISLHLTGWFDAELVALLAIALLGAARLAAGHHDGGAGRAHMAGPGAGLAPWAGRHPGGGPGTGAPWAPPPAPPAPAGWGPGPTGGRSPSWGELPPPTWERPERGGDR